MVDSATAIVRAVGGRNFASLEGGFLLIVLLSVVPLPLLLELFVLPLGTY